MKRFTSNDLWLAAILLALAGGCSPPAENSNLPENTQADGSLAPAAHANANASSAPVRDGEAKDSAARPSSPWDEFGKLGMPKDSAKTNSDSASTAPAPGKELKKAAVGMGEKGRGYGGGIVTTPVKAYWNVKEQLALDLIKHNMDLYKAQDPNGKGPKTHDEFMRKIVKDNDIKLPVLPAGQRYVYDPRTEELYVEQPKEP